MASRFHDNTTTGFLAEYLRSGEIFISAARHQIAYNSIGMAALQAEAVFERRCGNETNEEIRVSFYLPEDSLNAVDMQTEVIRKAKDFLQDVIDELNNREIPNSVHKMSE